MRFVQIDKIARLDPGKSITAVKTLLESEEYLQDHFPEFPVMPGVLMLEALYQTSAWLVRVSEDFANSMVILQETRSVKYSGFVAPDDTLTLTANIIKQDDSTTTLKAQGTVTKPGAEPVPAVSARLILERFNLVDRIPQRAATDTFLRRELKLQLAEIYQPTGV